MSVSAGHMHSVTARDSVDVRLGTLECRGLAPTADTAQRRYGRLAFVCGGEVFLSRDRGDAIDCMRTEFPSVGDEENELR